MESAPLSKEKSEDSIEVDTQKSSRIIGMKSVTDILKYSASAKKIIKVQQSSIPFCKFKEFSKMPKYNIDMVITLISHQLEFQEDISLMRK